ncbi:phthiocerol/phthiodiolone dimycocerosyl transferase family protein [Oscillatoria salina]|uniref:phthiocerol/phthiodiolone dimycocerosyl transferase family protein n=1 Tax=Oscillatoria salina TaxID=331517 RepID=UPI001CCF1071|nr:condensation domain-containing protein [Oscillatoria salina]
MTNRKLVSIEQGMEILNQVASSFNIVTISRIKGFFSGEILRQALDLLQSRHERLNYHIVGSSDNLSFEKEGTQTIPLRVVEKLHERDWQEIVYSEQNEKIASSQCLMRVVLVLDREEKEISHLITTIHHAIADGFSNIYLHQEILTYCDKISCGEEILSVSRLPALPPVTELIAKSSELPDKLRSLLLILQLQWKRIWYRPQSLEIEKSVAFESRRSQVIFAELDAQITEKLVAICRKEKTSVQGALCAAMLLAVARKINIKNKSSAYFTCQSYVDLRDRLQPPLSKEHLAALIAPATTFHLLKPETSFWHLAREVKENLEKQIQRGDIFLIMPVLRQMVEFFLAHPQEVPVSIGVSNLGRLNISQNYRLFELEAIRFLPAQAAYSGIFTATVNTFAGKMLLNFPYSEPSLSHETMETIVNSTLSILVAACEEKPELAVVR